VLIVAAYVFIAPNVDLARDLQWHDGQRLGQLVMLVFVVAALLMPDAARKMTAVWSDFRFGIRAALATAFALGLASSILASLSRWALLEWGMSWLLLVSVFAVAAQRRQFGERLDPLLPFLCFVTAAAYAVSVVTIYITMLTAGPAYGMGFNVLDLYPNFSNVRFFGYVQTMLLPLLLLPAMWWGTTPARRFLLWSVPVLWWMMALGSGSRGTWVALLVGVVAVLLFAGRAGRKWLYWQLGALLGGAIAYALLILLIPHWLEQPAAYLHRAGDIFSLSLREVLWSSSIEFATAHPLLGIGPMHYAYFGPKVAAHPHNAVLQWLAEWGVPATLLLVVVCAVAGLAFASHVRRAAADISHTGMVRIALLAALAGAAAQSMVDGVLVMPVSQTLLALLCGWAIALYQAERGSGIASDGSVQRIVIWTTTAVAAVAVAWGVAPELGQLAAREQAYLAAYPPENPALPNLMPRFWTQGRILE
jgi:hypothetical protein